MTVPVTPRPAATVLLVRQRAEMEVLMVERHQQAYFASALVFPGGVVGDEDFGDHWNDLALGGGVLAASERALRIAAFRELYEETGLLLGSTNTPPALEDRSPQSAFTTVLRRAAARLDLDALHRFAHWVTPEAAPKRFDTHFFLCALESDIEPISDGHETVSVDWLSPGRILELADRGERKVVFPTRLNLELLAKSATVDQAIEAARARRIVTVTPRIDRLPEGTLLSVPPEAGYGPRTELVPRD